MRKHGLLLTLATITIVCSGCTWLGLAPDASEADDAKPEKKAPLPVPIEAAHAARGDISSHFETTARVQAENRVELLTKGSGECVEIRAEEGDRVEKDQILAELDKEDALVSLRQTEIQVAQNKTSYEIAETSLAEGLGAKVERDNARFAYEQSLANLATQRLQVDNLTIRATIGGVVTQRQIQEGQMVSTGMAAFSLVDPTSYMLAIHPPEKALPRLSVGQEARVRIDSVEGRDFPARLRRINPSVDPTNGTVKVVLDFDEDALAHLRESAFARVRLIMETHQDVLVVPKDVLVEENGRTYLFVVTEKVEEEPEETTDDADDKPDEADALKAETPGDAEDAEAEADDEADDEAGDDDEEEEEEEPADAENAETEAEADDEEEEEPQGPTLIATRVEVETGFEDSDRIEIVSGIEDDTLIVTLGQHTLKQGAVVKVTNAETLMAAKADVPVEEALAAAKEAREKSKDKDSKKPGRRHGKRH